MIALVQTASTAPSLLFGLAAGALADIMEKYFGERIARATARHMEYPYPDADARRIQL